KSRPKPGGEAVRFLELQNDLKKQTQQESCQPRFPDPFGWKINAVREERPCPRRPIRNSFSETSLRYEKDRNAGECRQQRIECQKCKRSGFRVDTEDPEKPRNDVRIDWSHPGARPRVFI